ncbi:GspH/FimT family pseudopilin [Marinobacter sp. M216]|uniref:Type II secretion system protein H n=1 Tax=Marinobacter albus TaxID=3030833 RepID=A0ABT7HHL9_9GAMM|nr:MULTISPECIES: GspH/FimT family pseudopilin [unclassified Marinobacter]MBW7473103.1 GspH/FimT family pseudopilin [Marinobacter sp. F4218]MDK9559504.1 GspH/FimT family pseudopilin [Marinobacter sp. M216]
MHATRRLAGYTLPELIITIAILGILSSLAVQGWNTALEKSRHRTVLESYHSLFAFARWAAASKHTLITLCPLSDQNRCMDDWQKPISVFIDKNNDKKPDNDQVLKIFAPPGYPFRTRSRTAGRGYFQFNQKGFAYGAIGSLVLCPADVRTGTMTYLAVNMVGRFRVQSDEDGDGLIELHWGTEIRC